MLLDLLPYLVQAHFLLGAAGQDRGPPRRGRVLEQPQRRGELPGRGPRVPLVRPVGLVDRDDVGQFQHALLDALELVPGPGQGQQQEGVDHAGHRRLEPIKGQPPNLLRLPPGCAFAPRCAYRMPICDEPVPLYDFGDGHVARCYLYDERAKGERPIDVETVKAVRA